MTFSGHEHDHAVTSFCFPLSAFPISSFPLIALDAGDGLD
jgi:hypothetical protein